MNEFATFDVIELEKIRVGVSEYVSVTAISNLGMSPVSGHLVMRLDAYVLGHQEKKLVVKYPRDWWQAVKEHFAPGWFLTRYPVKYRRHTLTGYQIVKCRDLRVPEHFGTTVPFLTEFVDEA